MGSASVFFTVDAARTGGENNLQKQGILVFLNSLTGILSLPCSSELAVFVFVGLCSYISDLGLFLLNI